MRSAQRYFSLLLALLCLFLHTSLLLGAPMGHFNAILQDPTGKPLANILVALLQQSSKLNLPILTRSNAGGEVQIRDIEIGSYEILVKSSRYRSPEKTTIHVIPGKTTVTTLVLQQLLKLNPNGGHNLSIKTLLRTADNQRLIFRGFGHPRGTVSESSKPFFEEAAFDIYTGTGVGGDYFVFPTDSAGGTTSNFALSDSSWGNNKYIFAGQLNSGEDSLWRLKNFIEHPLNDSHSLRVFVGYGRTTFEQPSLGLLNNPIALGDDPEFARTLGTTKILNLGFEDDWTLGEAVSVVWGLDIDQVRTNITQTFVSPNAKLAVSATETTRVEVLMASRRITQQNSVALPNGERVDLGSTVYLSKIGDQVNMGTARHYQGSVVQTLDESTEVEFAVYENLLFGGGTPFVAVFQQQPDIQLVSLTDEQAHNSGYRITLMRNMNTNLDISVSYIRGNAAGIDYQGATVIFDDSVSKTLLVRDRYNVISAQVQTYIPTTRTRINALVKFVTNGQPVTTLDAFSDRYETGNEGINIFIRQPVPVPMAWLSLIGLDFLTAYEVEALLDIRNLTNKNLGKVNTTLGDVVLLRTPRSVRGGISFRF